jgi:endoglucanase
MSASHLTRVVLALLALNGLASTTSMALHGDAEGTIAADNLHAAVEDGQRFLDRYVAADGRVIRHDQGGDTVSEGQAYALLVAVGLEDRTTFDRVWAWTTRHLSRPDHLLAWRWADGDVVDQEPAADADLDAAWALSLAAARWPDGPYAAAADDLAQAVATKEMATVDGRRVLAAGPWAVGAPPAPPAVIINPSYASPLADAALLDAGAGPADAARDRRAGNRSVISALVAEAGTPPDWARSSGTVSPTASGDPDGTTPGRFGWDAVRVPLRFAASCLPVEQAVAARIWPAMQRGAGVDLMGDHPAWLVGGAAAAAAAGERQQAGELLDQATERDRRDPTYYGGALTALARLLLTTTELGGCPPLAVR